MLYGYTILDATKLLSPFMVCTPVVYVPEAIVWSLVVGVYVVAPLVVTDAVNETDEFPEVPIETYPALTCGVFETDDFESVSVLVPVLTEAPVADIDDAGVALPLATDFVAWDA